MKILDFGLAKQTAVLGNGGPFTTRLETLSGTVLGPLGKWLRNKCAADRPITALTFFRVEPSCSKWLPAGARSGVSLQPRR